MRSVQIFDKYGTAVHKIYPQSIAETVWDDFLANFNKRRILAEDIEAVPPPVIDVAPEINLEKLRSDWLNLQDTHDFHAMLGAHKVPRLTAFVAVGENLARKVNIQSLIDILNAARKADLTFMIFVGNGRMIQIRSGTIQQTRSLGSWFNILDADFNLHVNMSKLDSAWIVNKPSRHGLVRSLEVFDARGDLAVTLFGYRTEDLEVDPRWAELLDKIVPAGSLA